MRQRLSLTKRRKQYLSQVRDLEGFVSLLLCLIPDSRMMILSNSAILYMLRLCLLAYRFEASASTMHALDVVQVQNANEGSASTCSATALESRMAMRSPTLMTLESTRIADRQYCTAHVDFKHLLK
jgi:hypothetical protein